MNFSEHPPSKQWAALNCRGEKFAEVWFKPEDAPDAVIFRIPHASFQMPGMDRQLTIENLLKAVAIVPEEVDSWRHGEVSHSGRNGSSPEFRDALPPPPPELTHLDILVHLNLPPTPLAENDIGEPQISPARWQELDARWKAILGLEATMDTLRIGMESLQTELEASCKRALTMEEKNHALRADVAQWTKAKTRVHNALPKLKDFIHRAIWAMGAPERKRLEELYKNHIQPQIPFPGMGEVLKHLEQLQKDRQVLSAVGKTVHQESKAISANVQSALRTLQNNAAANAQKKKEASRGGKFMKDLRRMSGA